jgi:long-chain fatty acid transport protein
MRALFAGITLLAATFAATPSHANGFLIYDLSGKALGQASAVSADASEPAAIWFNPAALSYLKGVNVSAGAVIVSARSHFKAADTGAETSSERGNFVLPTLFASAAVSERVAVGMGVYSAFGIGVSWPREWVGRESAISASLRTLTFNPTVALKLSPQWSLGAGFDALRSTVDFQNGLPPIVGGDVRLVGGTWGFGFNAAALYRAIPDRLHFALTYRSRVKLKFDGNADFSPANRDFERTLADQPGKAGITLPDIITAGVMAKVHPAVTLGFDVNTVLWSTYERINIDFSNAPDRALNPKGRDSFTVRAGADFLTPEPGFHVRAGVIFDRGAIPSKGLGPALPESDRIDVTMGLGYEHAFWKADVGYMLVMFLPTKATSGVESPEGTYRTTAQLLGLTLGVHF